MKRKTFHYYSYDFIQNPWLGGGGAYRDMEILSRFQNRFDSIRLYVGHFPGARRQILRGVEVIPLGFGTNEIISRITFVLAANIRMLVNGRVPMGIALSPYAPFLAARLHRKSLVGVLHHIIGENWVRKLGWPGRMVCALEMRYYRIPRYFVVVNQDIADTLEKLNSSAEVFVSANAFDESLLHLADTSNSKKPYLLFIGRVDSFMKGLDLLVETFARISSRYPDLELIVAGKGDTRSESLLKSLVKNLGIENRVAFRIDIGEAEKRDLLSGCLLFCSPSRFEGFGIAALEANAAGKAVVVSQASGFRNSIRNNYSGVLVDLREKEGLDKAISDLLDHPENRVQMGRQAREWAGNFTWDGIAERELAWVQSTLGWN